MSSDISENVNVMPGRGFIPRRGLLITSAAVVVMIVISFVASTYLPSEAKFPAHWNLAGEVDRYASRNELLWLLPGIALLLGAVLSLLPLIDPRSENLRRSRKPYLLVLFASQAVLLSAHCAMIASAIGWSINIPKVAGAAVGVMFIVMGNYLGKIRSNFLIGIRTPWTLSSELSWNRTHRLGGRCLVALGLLAMATSAVAPPIFLVVVLMTAVPLTLGLAVYSYFVWKSDLARVGS